MKISAIARIALAVVSLSTFDARAEEALLVYGPGGPAPAMKEAADVFAKAHGIRVEVTAGPTPGWIARAREDATSCSAAPSTR